MKMQITMAQVEDALRRSGHVLKIVSPRGHGKTWLAKIQRAGKDGQVVSHGTGDDLLSAVTDAVDLYEHREARGFADDPAPVQRTEHGRVTIFNEPPWDGRF